MKFTLYFHFIKTESIGLQVLLDHLKSPPYLSFRLYEHIHLATVAAAAPFFFWQQLFWCISTLPLSKNIHFRDKSLLGYILDLGFCLGPDVIKIL